MSEELVCVSLKDHLLRLMEEEHKRVELRFDNMDKALLLADRLQDHRFNELNHVREDRDRDRNEFLKKETYDSKTQGYDTWCSSVNDRLTKIEQRSVTWTAAIALFFSILQIAMYFIHGVK